MNLPRNAQLWVPSLLRSRMQRLLRTGKPKRLWVAITDHFEPMGGGVTLERGLQRMKPWQELWPEIAMAAPVDANGKPPCFTCFYPQEEYQREILATLEPLRKQAICDVEVHIHHDRDTRESMQAKLLEFLQRLHEVHGMLRLHHGRLAFGFIHGNWALDNSRPDGRWCGVQGELQLLRDLGCYADYTMPSVPSATQSRIVNQIYWTTGDPAKPRGFDHGVPALPGAGVRGDLLMIPGPIGLRLRERLLPRVETGELAVYDQPTASRVERWLDLAPRIGGDIFLKLYGHSARDDNAAALLGTRERNGSLAGMFRDIATAATRRGLELHWASAFEMFRAVEDLVTAPASQAVHP